MPLQGFGARLRHLKARGTSVRARLDRRSHCQTKRGQDCLLRFNWRALIAETGICAGKRGTETLPAIRRGKRNDPPPSVGLVERPMNRMRGIVSFDPRLLALAPFLQVSSSNQSSELGQSIAEFRSNSQSPPPIVSLHCGYERRSAHSGRRPWYSACNYDARVPRASFFVDGSQAIFL